MHVHWQLKTCLQIHLPAMIRWWSHQPRTLITQSKILPKLTNYDAVCTTCSNMSEDFFVTWETGMLYIIFEQFFFPLVTCYLFYTCIQSRFYKKIVGIGKAQPIYIKLLLSSRSNNWPYITFEIFFSIKRISIPQPFN